MKIVVITSSPHPHDESTSIYLADRFTKGATQAGHEVFPLMRPTARRIRAAAAISAIWTDRAYGRRHREHLDAEDARGGPARADDAALLFRHVGTLKTIVDRFYSRTGKLHGKKSILMATAYNSADWTMSALVDHYDTLVRYMEWQDVGKVLGIGCGARSLVEHSKFGDMAETMGANL